MKNYRQQGAVTFIVIALIIFGLVLTTGVLLVDRTSLFSLNTNYNVDDVQATSLAEAGLDKAIGSLNQNEDFETGEFPIGEGEVVTSVIADPNNPGAKIVIATAYIPTQENPRVTRKLSVVASRVANISLPYAIHGGAGGLFLGFGSQIANGGSVFSNGPVLMSDHVDITGRLTVSGAQTPIPIAETAPCSHYPNGRINCWYPGLGSRNGGDTSVPTWPDRAQDFWPVKDGTLDRVYLAMGRTATPPDYSIEVNITKTNTATNFPDPNQILAHATIQASDVPYKTASNEFSWVELKFATAPILKADTQYWIVLDSQLPDNVSNLVPRFVWYTSTLVGKDIYPQGKTYQTDRWPATTWSNLSSNPAVQHVDGVFKVFLRDVFGGYQGPNSVEGITVWNLDKTSTVNLDIRANTIKGVYSTGHAYYQTVDESAMISDHAGTSDLGDSCDNNQYCHHVSSDPPAEPLPITSNLRDGWKNEAEAGGVSNGNVNTCPTAWGPQRINGNVTLSNCIVTLKGPVFINGNLTLDNDNLITLDSIFGKSSGVILVSGKIIINNRNTLRGTGANNSTILLLSESANSATQDAIEVRGSDNFANLYASTGGIKAEGTNTFERLVAAGRINFKNGNNITVQNNPFYSTMQISSGLEGGYSALQGTYSSE